MKVFYEQSQEILVCSSLYLILSDSINSIEVKGAFAGQPSWARVGSPAKPTPPPLFYLYFFMNSRS